MIFYQETLDALRTLGDRLPGGVRVARHSVSTGRERIGDSLHDFVRYDILFEGDGLPEPRKVVMQHGPVDDAAMQTNVVEFITEYAPTALEQWLDSVKAGE